jgi:hypothetical protein
MSKIKATIRFLHAWRHPDQIAREVEGELRFHIELRTRANIETGMKPDEARLAAQQSFGDFHRFKTECCEISREPSFDLMPLKMGLHISLAIVAGAAAVWAVNVPHHNFTSILRQLVAIAILTCLFAFVRRARSRQQLAGDCMNDIFIEEPGKSWKDEYVASHDDEGRTPVERVFKSE